MSASARENRIELIVDINIFYKRVGMVDNYYELEWLGFKTHYFSGSFEAESVPELLKFCQENLDYHIVSYTDHGRYENKYVPGHVLYRLANGDRDPTLVLNHLVDPNRVLIAEEVVCAALAVLHDVKTGDDR